MFGSSCRKTLRVRRSLTVRLQGVEVNTQSLQIPQRSVSVGQVGWNKNSASSLRMLSTRRLTRTFDLRSRCTPNRPRRTSTARRHESTTTAAAASAKPALEPSVQDLKLVALGQAIPFVGFGFMDNSILIVAGDAIDTSLGIWLGISTLCAAAIGNIISDLAGIGLGTVIEDFCAKVLKLPVPNLTTAQRQLRSVRTASNLGMAIGMTIGCVLGMFPLFFIDSTKVEQMKKRAHLESLFKDVVTEAKTLIGAESTCLYLRVHLQDNKKSSAEGVNPGQSGKYLLAATPHEASTMRPAVDGDHLYAMHYVVPDREREETHSPRFVKLGKGLVSRAILTGEAWNIQNVHQEPDFLPDYYEADGSIPSHLKSMVVVPVLDSQGQAIGVLRALNKLSSEASSASGGGGSGFRESDVQILKSLASHISVSLQGVFRDEHDEEMRLRDTIRILKEHGLEGIVDDSRSPYGGDSPSTVGQRGRRPSLFPSTPSSS